MPGNVERLNAEVEKGILVPFCSTRQVKYLNLRGKQGREFTELVRRVLGARHQEGMRPLPVLLAGKEVDLYGLFLRVRAFGGYNGATSTHMWPVFSEDLGHGVECGPSLKLVYAKYLKSLESWTQISGKEDKNTQPDFEVDYDGRIFESPFKKSKCEEIYFCSPDSKKDESLANVLLWIKRLALNPGDRKKGQGSRGSKHNEAWVNQCATYASRIRDLLWRKDCYSSVALTSQSKVKVPPSIYYQEVIPNKQALDRLRATQERIAIYGEHQRALAKLDSGATMAALPWGLYSSSKGFSVGRLAEESNSFFNTMNEMISLGNFEARARKRIPISSYFQASIPDLICNKSSTRTNIDNVKFLGTLVWLPDSTSKISVNKEAAPNDRSIVPFSYHPESIKHARSRVKEAREKLKMRPASDARVNTEMTSNDRSIVLFSNHPESIEHVQFRVKEAREKLKTELNRSFKHMGFEDMGEVVARVWTKDEEIMFESTVSSNPIALERSYWDALSLAFPGRSTKDLVSYYFNVFVLRRRAAQNRAVSSSIDSDDEDAQLLALA